MYPFRGETKQKYVNGLAYPYLTLLEPGFSFMLISEGQTPKSDIPPNIAPKIVTPENCLQIWDSSTTLIGQLAIVTLFGAIFCGIPLSGPYPFQNKKHKEFQRV